MSRLFAGAVLAVVLLGSTLLLATPSAKSCSAGCCSRPADCFHPSCCVKH
jgi:hypothetical protein